MLLTLVSVTSIDYKNVIKRHVTHNQKFNFSLVKQRVVLAKWDRRDFAVEYVYEFVTDEGYSWFVIKSKYQVWQTTEIPKKWLYHYLSNQK